MALSDTSFERPEYGKEKKRKLEPLEDLHPRPVELRGIACANLPALLEKICGVHLSTNHIYHAQVQGQMGIGNRQWCDFVVYTTKGIHVQPIDFDVVYWERTLLPKLMEFYDNYLGPEIVSPVHVLELLYVI